MDREEIAYGTYRVDRLQACVFREERENVCMCMHVCVSRAGVCECQVRVGVIIKCMCVCEYKMRVCASILCMCV